MLQMKIAHREQVALTVDLDDVSDIDTELAEAVVENTRRYVSLFSDAVHDLLPEYKEKEVLFQKVIFKNVLKLRILVILCNMAVYTFKLYCNVMLFSTAKYWSLVSWSWKINLPVSGNNFPFICNFITKVSHVIVITGS